MRPHPVLALASPQPYGFWISQGPPTAPSSGTYGLEGHGYNPISMGQIPAPTYSGTSWWSDPCHIMWLIAGAASAAASALVTYNLRKKKPKGRIR